MTSSQPLTLVFAEKGDDECLKVFFHHEDIEAIENTCLCRCKKLLDRFVLGPCGAGPRKLRGHFSELELLC